MACAETCNQVLHVRGPWVSASPRSSWGGSLVLPEAPGGRSPALPEAPGGRSPALPETPGGRSPAISVQWRLSLLECTPSEDIRGAVLRRRTYTGTEGNGRGVAPSSPGIAVVHFEEPVGREQFIERCYAETLSSAIPVRLARRLQRSGPVIASLRYSNLWALPSSGREKGPGVYLIREGSELSQQRAGLLIATEGVIEES